jgi:hypothetical protein
VPTLIIDNTPHVIQHPSQAGVLLGLHTPPALRDAPHVAWQVDAILEAWVELVTATPWNALREPMPVLGRTPLALAVDASIGIAALPAAFSTGWFHWPGDPRTGETGDASVVAYEADVVAGIADRVELLAFVQPVAATWRVFVLANEEAFAREPDRPVRTPRGELAWVSLLEAQRLHSAQHYRQAVSVVRSLGHPVPALDLASLAGLKLPGAIY